MRQARFISELPKQQQAFRAQRLCQVIVVLIKSQPSSTNESLCPYCRRNACTARQGSLQKVAALAHITAHRPEPPQCCAQAQDHLPAILEVSLPLQPEECCSQVFVLALQSLQPFCL